MAELKTTANDASVAAFLDAVEHEKRRAACYELLQIMQEATGEPPQMWGTSIVGFGKYRYKYESGREGEWFFTGFSPKKQNLTIYIIAGFEPFPTLMQQLGKYKTGSSCLYINKMEDIDRDVLKKLIEDAVQYMKQRYP